MERTWDEARTLLFERAIRAGESRRTRTAALDQAVGEIAARSVRSPLPVPHFDSSAMDGFAVRGPGPWEIVAEYPEDAVGENLHRRRTSLDPGQAVGILTGAVLPRGAEGILRTEHSERHGAALRPAPSHPYSPGRDLRRAGEELPEGKELLAAGTRIGPRHVALLGVCGVDAVEIVEPPTVALGLTGNEVVSHGLPGPGEVRDAFSASFPELLHGWGARILRVDRIEDDAAVLESWIDGGREDVLVLTGGSGHSDQDFVRRVLERRCPELVATSISMRPGHPTMLGVLPDDRLALGLPGNPLAAHVALYSFVPVLLAGLRGMPFPGTEHRVWGEEVGPVKHTSQRILPCLLEEGRIVPVGRAQAHMLSGLAEADVLGVVGPEGALPGETARVLPLTD